LETLNGSGIHTHEELDRRIAGKTKTGMAKPNKRGRSTALHLEYRRFIGSIPESKKKSQGNK